MGGYFSASSEGNVVSLLRRSFNSKSGDVYNLSHQLGLPDAIMHHAKFLENGDEIYDDYIDSSSP